MDRPARGLPRRGRGPAHALAARGTPALVGCHVSHVYPTGACLYFTYLARAEAGAELEQWGAAKTAASDALVAAGGTITHHHAVGRDHAPWLRAEVGELGVDLLRAPRRADPTGIMNPQNASATPCTGLRLVRSHRAKPLRARWRTARPHRAARRPARGDVDLSRTRRTRFIRRNHRCDYLRRLHRLGCRLIRHGRCALCSRALRGAGGAFAATASLLTPTFEPVPRTAMINVAAAAEPVKNRHAATAHGIHARRAGRGASALQLAGAGANRPSRDQRRQRRVDRARRRFRRIVERGVAQRLRELATRGRTARARAHVRASSARSASLARRARRGRSSARDECRAASRLPDVEFGEATDWR